MTALRWTNHAKDRLRERYGRDDVASAIERLESLLAANRVEGAEVAPDGSTHVRLIDSAGTVTLVLREKHNGTLVITVWGRSKATSYWDRAHRARAERRLNRGWRQRAGEDT